MASEWFIQRGGSQTGPYSSQQLRQLANGGKLSPDDLIRKSDMKDWVAARTAKGLFSTTAATPTPSTSTAAAPATAETPEKEKPPSSSKAGRIALLIGVLLAAYFFRDSLPSRNRRARRANAVAVNQQGGQPTVAAAPAESDAPRKPPSLATGRPSSEAFIPWLREVRGVRFDTPPEGSSSVGTKFAALAPQPGTPCRLHIGSWQGNGGKVSVIIVEDESSKKIFSVLAGTPFSLSGNGSGEIGPLNEFVWHVLPECEVRHLIRDNLVAVSSGGMASKQFDKAGVSVTHSGREMRAVIAIDE
jgi:hypothetical protein